MHFLDMDSIWYSISQLLSEERAKWLPRPLARLKAKGAMISALGEQLARVTDKPTPLAPGLVGSQAVSTAPTGQV